MQISKDIANTIVDPQAYANWERHHDAFRELRKSAPLAVAEPDGYDPFWVATKYEDIKSIEIQNDVFHNGDQPIVVAKKANLAQVAALSDAGAPQLRTLVSMDNPDHREYRMLTQSWFLPQNLRKLEGRIGEIADEFVDKMLDLGSDCDFARDIAFLYPLRVVMEVIGVPASDEPRMLKLTQELFGAEDPEMNRSGKKVTPEEQAKIARDVVQDFYDYFVAMTEDRKANPREDLATLISNAKIQGKDIPILEAISYYVIAATAGHDTTAASTAGSAWALAERPDQYKALREDPSLLPGLIDEAIRWETPVKHFMRTAVADAEISGQKISKGDWIMLSYASGNRDEDQFDTPYEFDFRRSPNKHIAFGYGAHVCLGQHLARLEMRLLWERLLKRVSSIELSGEASRMAAAFVTGPKSIPMHFKAA